MCCAWMPGVSRVNFRGLPPGFQLTGGRGISIRATVQSCSDSLHSAKATGRPLSVSFFFLPVNTYSSSWSSSSSRACDTRSRIWSSRRIVTMIASSSTGGAVTSGGSDSATDSGTSPSVASASGAASSSSGDSGSCGPGASVLTKGASPSPGVPCNVVHAARRSDRAASSAAAAACRVQGVISSAAPIDSGPGSVFDDTGLRRDVHHYRRG